MTAATSNRPTNPASRASTSTNGSGTDIIPPRPANPPAIANERSATTRAASSNDNAPDTHAAAISPCECPNTASGRTPNDSHTAANDTITAHDTGCTTSTRSNDGEPSTPRTTSSNDHSTNPDNARAHSSRRAANTAEDSNSSAPIPTHCEPCPGNTNTVRPSTSATPETTFAAGRSSARARVPASASSRLVASTTARRSSRVRVTTDE